MADSALPLDSWEAVDSAFLHSDQTELAVSLGTVDGAARQWDQPVLTRSQWNRLTPFALSTARLQMRSVAAAEMDDFARMLDDEDIARMLVNLPHPVDVVAGRDWWHKRRFVGRPGFQLGIFDAQDRPVGAVGISALSHALVYFFAPDARGRGYGHEVIAPFCRHVQARWQIDQIFAGVFTDNPASRHVLEKAGFVVTGTGLAASPARSEPAMFWEMSLRR